MRIDRRSAKSLINGLNDPTEASTSSAFGPDASLREGGDMPKEAWVAQALKKSMAVSKGPPRPGMGPCWNVPSGLIPVTVPILGVGFEIIQPG